MSEAAQYTIGFAEVEGNTYFYRFDPPVTRHVAAAYIRADLFDLGWSNDSRWSINVGAENQVDHLNKETE